MLHRIDPETEVVERAERVAHRQASVVVAAVAERAHHPTMAGLEAEAVVAGDWAA